MASSAVTLPRHYCLASSREESLHRLYRAERDFSERVQRIRNRERVYSRPLIEYYVKGQASVLFDLRLSGDWNSDRQSFADSSPSHPFSSLTRLIFQHRINYSRYAGQRNQEFVLVPDVQVVNCAEESVPSFAVWSEVVYNESEKIRTDGVYLHAPESAFQLMLIGSDREFGITALGECGDEGRKQCVPAVVNGGLEIVYSIPDYQRKIVERKGFCEIVLKSLIASLRVDFTRNALSFWRTEISDLPLKVCDMYIGPFDLEPS
jgi:hypothetical protein